MLAAAVAVVALGGRPRRRAVNGGGRVTGNIDEDNDDNDSFSASRALIHTGQVVLFDAI